MPGSLPAIPGAKVVRALETGRIYGREDQRQPLGDAHRDGRTVVVPVYAGRDIAKGTLRNILAIIGMDAGGVPEVALRLRRVPRVRGS
jgi:hypothetical protein